ncbi:MAG: protein kinase [Candidatus Wallbacteria bacterium]|nr:protein kinase [Candidatus Wallbacteria bacterium]
MELSGQRFGQYQVGELLGKGGMGAVYRAVQVELGREVALKALPESLMGRGPELVKRFMREASICAKLSHPNIVKVFDFGFENDVYFYAMELLDATSLEDRMARSAGLGAAFTLKVARDLASALAYYLPQGIVHRDLKPGNIMLLKAGDRAVITDFGLVMDLSASRMTREGVVVGTPHYIAPELLARGNATAGADLWSVGVILYRMLSGQYPVGSDARDAMQLFAQISTREPKELREVKPDVPVGLATVVMNCLTKDLALRYSTGQELAADLEIAARRGKVERRAVPAADPGAAVPLAGNAAGPSAVRPGARPGTGPQPAASSTRVPVARPQPRFPPTPLALGCALAFALAGGLALHRRASPAASFSAGPVAPARPIGAESRPPVAPSDLLAAIAAFAPDVKAHQADDRLFRTPVAGRANLAAQIFSLAATSPLALHLARNPSALAATLAPETPWERRCQASRRIFELLQLDICAREWGHKPPFRVVESLARAMSFEDTNVAPDGDLTRPQAESCFARVFPAPAAWKIVHFNRSDADTYNYANHHEDPLAGAGMFLSTTDRVQDESIVEDFEVPAGNYRQLLFAGLMKDLDAKQTYLVELTPRGDRHTLAIPIPRLSSASIRVGWFVATTRMAPGVLPPGNYRLRLIAQQLLLRTVPRPNFSALALVLVN